MPQAQSQNTLGGGVLQNVEDVVHAQEVDTDDGNHHQNQAHDDEQRVVQQEGGGLFHLGIDGFGAGTGLDIHGLNEEVGQSAHNQDDSLLRRDSIHGPFAGTISVDEENEAIIANGNFIKVIYASNPSEVDYTAYGINNALVIDNTGKWRDSEGLAQHLKCPGAARVILTAPGKGTMNKIILIFFYNLL